MRSICSGVVSGITTAIVLCATGSVLFAFLPCIPIAVSFAYIGRK